MKRSLLHIRKVVCSRFQSTSSLAPSTDEFRTENRSSAVPIRGAYGKCIRNLDGVAVSMMSPSFGIIFFPVYPNLICNSLVPNLYFIDPSRACVSPASASQPPHQCCSFAHKNCIKTSKIVNWTTERNGKIIIGIILCSLKWICMFMWLIPCDTHFFGAAAINLQRCLLVKQWGNFMSYQHMEWVRACAI